MEIKLNFLGTGQAVPTARRNHPSILLQYSNENILIDCGEGTQRQFRKARLNPCKLTKLLITHWHGDHILGIPGLLQTLTLNGYNKTLEVYTPKRTAHFFYLMQKMFVYRSDIKINLHEVSSGKIIETSDFYVEAEKMFHDTPCLAYSFVEKDKIKINKSKMKKLGIKSSPLLKELKNGKPIKINGKMINPKTLTYTEKGKKITFIFDTIINNNAVRIAKDSDLLICESTYSEEERDLARDYKHLTARQAAEIAKKANCKKLCLIHISQRYENKEKILLKEVKKLFKNVFIAEDLMEISV